MLYKYICHALKMMSTQQQPHAAIPNVTPNTMHRAPTERRSSPVEAVLTGSRAALPGLIEILRGPHWGHGAINKG